MELLELMQKRRSIRQYTEEPVPADKLEKILAAGVLSPTSKSRMPWTFHVIGDKALLRELSGAKWHGARPLTGCTKAIVVAADSSVSDVWIEDCSIALTCMHLMAAEQGVGSCWVQMRLRKDENGGDAEQNVLDALGLEAPWRLVGILALGMPDEEKDPYTKDVVKTRLEEKVCGEYGNN